MAGPVLPVTWWRLIVGVRWREMGKSEHQTTDLDALTREPERHARSLREASRFHTKNLFGLWLLLIIGLSLYMSAIQLPFGEALLLRGYAMMLAYCLMLAVIFTGAYAFQEVSRVHKRIDAILKLVERHERHRIEQHHAD